jgi:hypothetical protein
MNDPELEKLIRLEKHQEEGLESYLEEIADTFVELYPMMASRGGDMPFDFFLNQLQDLIIERIKRDRMSCAPHPESGE